MFEKNYGKYWIPERLKQLVELQQQLNDSGQLKYGDLLGYYFSNEGIENRYLNTPLDVIPFARPGVDGIHFGFLTDFGQVDDLNNAYIVRVRPMDFDSPVHIVASNIDDFIRNICYFPNAMDMLDMTSSEEDIIAFLKGFSRLPTEDILTKEEYMIQRSVIEKFKLEPIKNFGKYFSKLHQQRHLDTILPTKDHLRIVANGLTLEEVQNNNVYFDHEGVDQLSISEVSSFFEMASYSAKLVFLREIQSRGLIWDNDVIKIYLKDQLRIMNLIDEAERILYP